MSQKGGWCRLKSSFHLAWETSTCTSKAPCLSVHQLYLSRHTGQEEDTWHHAGREMDMRQNLDITKEGMVKATKNWPFNQQNFGFTNQNWTLFTPKIGWLKQPHCKTLALLNYKNMDGYFNTEIHRKWATAGPCQDWKIWPIPCRGAWPGNFQKSTGYQCRARMARCLCSDANLPNHPASPLTGHSSKWVQYWLVRAYTCVYIHIYI